MATILMGYDTESAAVGEGLARFIGPEVPQYLPALDAESTVRGLEIMGGVHADLGVPATLFVCGRTLLHSLEAVQAAAGTGLFDVQQHTYSHLPFRDIYYSPAEGIEAVIPETPPVALREELSWTSDLIHRHTGSECVGLRTPFGYYRGLRGRPDLLGILRDCGIRYVTSWGRNEENANPTPWEVQPFTYDEEGFPEPRAAVPVLAGRHLVRPPRLGQRRRLPRRPQRRGGRDRRARPRLRRLLPRVGDARCGRRAQRVAPGLPGARESP